MEDKGQPNRKRVPGLEPGFFNVGNELGRMKNYAGDLEVWKQGHWETAHPCVLIHEAFRICREEAERMAREYGVVGAI